MKFMKFAKDGGPKSKVWGFFFIEIKPLFSVALLCFENGSRNAYHSHAFNCMSWVLKGKLDEEHLDGRFETHVPLPFFTPFFTFRKTCHKVTSVGRSWIFTIRGPWKSEWKEYLPDEQRLVTLTHGRKEVTNEQL